jgi:3-oxoacyl-[acyl-carrier protein] reductase
MTQATPRSVLVTGGNKGTGLAMVRTSRRPVAGDRVTMTYRSTEPDTP